MYNIDQFITLLSDFYINMYKNMFEIILSGSKVCGLKQNELDKGN